MPSLYAGFFGSWIEKVFSLITFYQTLKFHKLGALTPKYLNMLELLWILLRLCVRTSEHLFQVKRKPKELNSPDPIKDAPCYIFICQNWTHGPLQRDPHHPSGGSVTATCLLFEFLPRVNNILLMQISHSVQDFHSRQRSSFNGSVGSNLLTGRELRLPSKKLLLRINTRLTKKGTIIKYCMSLTKNIWKI